MREKIDKIQTWTIECVIMFKISELVVIVITRSIEVAWVLRHINPYRLFNAESCLLLYSLHNGFGLLYKYTSTRAIVCCLFSGV